MKKSFVGITMIALFAAFCIPSFAQGTNAQGGGKPGMEKPMMPKATPVTMIVVHEVQDFAKWLPVFESHADFRMKSGCTGADVYQDAAKPNIVTVVATFASLEQAQAFAGSEDLKSKMQESGVVGEPQFSMMANHYKHYKN